MLARLRKKAEDNEGGFTLIELLVVIIIIGILAAIAIPVFLNQRKKGYDAGVKSDLSQAANEMESAYTDAQVYPATVTIKVSPGDDIRVAALAAAAGGNDGYCIRGQNPKGTASGTLYYWYDSQKGGLQTGAPTATAPSGACAGTPTFTAVVAG